MKTIHRHLLTGDRTAAVWHAADKRLWSHAMLIAGTVSQELWKQVVQDFVRNEVKTLGAGMESLAVLYEIFGGNGEESIDELVPQSARLGQPMLTQMGSSQTLPSNPLDALDKWRETLALVISNRSPNDQTAIIALGKLLAGYGRVEAAHLCYLFARNMISFTGPEDPAASVSMFGFDHQIAPLDLHKDTDALLLTEIYELALSLAPAPAAAPIIPHLQAYKLYHALVLAEYGYRTEALKYCESIAAVLKSTTKPSPYFHRPLFNTLEELTSRLSQSPKDPTTGWLSKLSQDNISGSMWGAFSKFVAGGDDESTSSGLTRDSGLDVGPFSKVGPSPGVSRSQSSADLYGTYNGYSPTMSKTPQGPSQYNPMGGSYAPSNAYSPYAPRGSMEQGRPANAYQPSTGYNPYDSPMPSATSSTFNKQPGSAAPSPYMPQSAGFDNKHTFDSPARSTFEPTTPQIGYEPPSQPSYGYDEPTMNKPTTNDEEDEDKPKPKKKSFMDDDDDDAEFIAKAAALKKEAEEKKKKEEEKEAQAKSGAKSGWFGGWFAKKDQANKAKLGEESSFVYDPELKRWVNKKVGHILLIY